MDTDLMTDIFIYNDDSFGLTESERIVFNSGLDQKTKEYYYDIIRCRRAYDALDVDEKFLFYQFYFLEFDLKFLPQLQNIDTEQIKKDLSNALFKASYKFAQEFNAGFELTDFSGADVYNHSIKRVKIGKNAYKFVHKMAKLYDDFSKRALFALCSKKQSNKG